MNGENTSIAINLFGLFIAAAAVVVALIVGLLSGKYLQRNRREETELDLVRSIGKLEGESGSPPGTQADIAVVKAIVDRVEKRLGEVSKRTHDQGTSIQILTYDIKSISDLVQRIDVRIANIETKQVENRAAGKAEHDAAEKERIDLKRVMDDFTKTIISFRRRILALEQKIREDLKK